MSKYFRIQLLLMAFLIIQPFAAHARESIKVTNGEWSPFMSPSLKHYGILSHIASEAMSEVDIEIEYGFYPWQRAYYLAKEGRWDATLGWAKTPEREEAFYFSAPIYQTQVVFFHLKTLNFDWASDADLKGINVGVMRGTYAEQKLRQIQNSGLGVLFQPVDTELQNFRKLKAARIDLVAVDKDVGLSVLEKHFQESERGRFTYHSLPFYSQTLHVLFSKKSRNGEKNLRRFNKGLEAIKESDRLGLMWQKFRDNQYE
ncbi:putative ABC-type amino acid transport/signal transduction systems, periplasmic component/domain [Vibrio coralliirubri]|uniref:substrate-binding periplasmic protein n=1 Tax=Vibrio coralliirubri TaxID=1516159 RepID=UPI0006358BAF|nr:transporter substrate-binding domain-containing protein [Vibrio coralliirubri]CDT01583.1 putative ABC-type amino acid transport/signal transduction systems, periplasmic component/domain [Vibrio coralliirubri]